MGGAGGQTRRLPHTKPPFTVADIKKAIPQHCFKRSILRSFFDLVQDLIFAYIFYYISTQYFFDLPYPLHYLAWPLYWICQGCAISALWILGHECGHHAFSDYQLVDDTIGFIIHSAFLTPYFSWKISHRRHHSNTASLEREEVYLPLLKSKRGKIDYLLSHTVAGRAFVILIRLSAGWVLYLSFNLLGRKYGRFTNHFIPQSPIFSKDEQKQVILSDAGILATAYGLYCLVSANGLWWVIYVYGVPVLILNAFIALITYLHHTHAEIPYYDSFEWDWLRGGLATVDRDYGILNYLFHDIGSAHIMHHLFPSMPHYHTMEATKAIKPILGDYYHFDGTPILKAFWRETKECVYIEPDISNNKGVFWYTNDI